MGFKRFEEIPVWQDTHKIVIEIYQITKSFPKEEVFGLASQIRRSASSIAANIVEGFYKETTRELIRHLYHSRGSGGETLYHLLLAKDLKYLDDKKYIHIKSRLDTIAKQLNGWIKSMQNIDKKN